MNLLINVLTWIALSVALILFLWLIVVACSAIALVLILINAPRQVWESMQEAKQELFR